MPKNLIQLSFVAMIVAQGALAQSLHCRDLKPDVDNDAYRAFECVSKLDTDLSAALDRIAQLEAKLTELTSTVAANAPDTVAGPINERIDALVVKLESQSMVPAIGPHRDTRAIVAFASQKGEKTCPNGWSPFEPAKDRFIVGAGGKYPVVGGTGGEEMVTLSEAQMPRHGHSVFAVTDVGAPGIDGFLVRGPGPNRIPQGAVGTSGGNQPHNNMPPYIALAFCIKE